MSNPDMKKALDDAVRCARQAIDRHGVSDPAMRQIQECLRELAATPGLGAVTTLEELHESGAAAKVIASEGAEGITLIYASFPPERPTPIHDHGSWGVAHVLAGRDRYIHWRRVDDGEEPHHAHLEVAYERLMRAGDSVYWFGPPQDIHSQQGHAGETAWEFVMFGHDPMQVERHYFDLESGQVTSARPQ